MTAMNMSPVFDTIRNMTENVHYIKGEELYRTIGELRFARVRHIFVGAFQRSREQRKMMLDPMDILSTLIQDPELEELLNVAGINREDVELQIADIEAGTPKGLSALRLFSVTNALDDYHPNKFRSYVLDQSILLAIKIADEEQSFDITSHHILAGMLLQGMNTASLAFRNLGLTRRQFRILARLPMNTN
jgi:ATP-dependent Clp protease ATP-binding subunit ClpA